MILDEIKLISGDSIINEDHIKYLLNEYRPFVLKQYYEKKRLEAELFDFSEVNYQELCFNLEQIPPIDGEPCEGALYLRSSIKAPKLLGLGTPVISPMDFYQGINIALVSKNRMRYVGENKWMKNIIYCSIGPDQYLYFKSNNPQFQYLKRIKFSAIFEDAEEAANLSCNECAEDEKGANCDVLDKEFALESHLVPQLKELVLKEVLGAAYRPADETNNDSDDLANLSHYIARNVKSQMAKQMTE